MADGLLTAATMCGRTRASRRTATTRPTAGWRTPPVPRLTGGCGGTTVHLAPASLTVGPDAPSLERAVTDVRVDGGTVEVTWEDDGSRTRVAFGPVEVCHTRP